MLRTLRILIIALILSGGLVLNSTAEACPMCQVANEDNTADATNLSRPRAFMYSILFMLAMPASLLSAFGISFYRLSQKRTALNEEFVAATEQGNYSEGSDFRS